MSRVYAVNKTAGDFSHAMSFTGEPLIFLTHGFVQLTQATFYSMGAILKDFRDEDFLLLSGSSVLVAYAIAFLKDTLGVDSINVLLYRPWDNTYTPLRINGYISEFEPLDSAGTIGA